MEITYDDAYAIVEAAGYECVEVRDFPLWPSGGYTVALVCDQSDFQRVLKRLQEDEPDLAESLGDWTMEGVALSTVWYWNAPLTEAAHEYINEIEEKQEAYK